MLVQEIQTCPIERAQSAISLRERKLQNIMQELVMRKSYAKVDEVALVPEVHLVASVDVVPIVAAILIHIVAPPPYRMLNHRYPCVPRIFLNT